MENNDIDYEITELDKKIQNSTWPKITKYEIWTYGVLGGAITLGLYQLFFGDGFGSPRSSQGFGLSIFLLIFLISNSYKTKSKMKVEKEKAIRRKNFLIQLKSENEKAKRI